MKKNCPQCGTRVNNDLPGGLCPACLMAVARQSQEEIDRTQARARSFETPEVAEMTRLFPELDILQLVGSGGMGAVYQARQKNLDRIVAIKVFIDRTDDPEFAARFQREARALARLNHQNIVTVHDFGVRENVHYLIMEYVDGVNLRQLSQEETLSPEMALQMVPQLCDALQYAHDNGVIHRDIKPENLLLDTHGNITIADFGLAKLTGGDFNGTLTRTQQVMGTFNYMAPEQRERPTEVDHRADIYSLGVVIYEMLTGELPIGRFQPPSSKSKVNAELDEAVMRALDKDPDRRFQQASEFKTGVRTAGYSVPQSPVAPVPPVKRSLNASDAPRGTRAMFTLMAGREKKGNWMPGSPQLAFTMMGGAELDLTNVQVDDVDITAFTLMGGVEIIVPHGASVDLDGFMLMGATVDNVKMNPNAHSNMRVRIRSWGAMGGCEVRTPKPAEDRAAAIVQRQSNGKPSELARPSIIGSTLMALYTFIAMMVSIAIPIIFLAGNFNMGISRRESHMVGILVAISAGMFWVWSGYFRILFNAGPKDDSDQAITEYHTGSKIGSMIRIVATAVLFACPMLFVIENYEGGGDELKFAAIVCGIVGGALFATASKVDDSVFAFFNRGQDGK